MGVEEFLSVFCLFSVYNPLRLNTQKGFHDHQKVHSNFILLSCTTILALLLIKYKICSLRLFVGDPLLLCYWFTVVKSGFKWIVFISSTFFLSSLLQSNKFCRILDNFLPEKLHPICTYYMQQMTTLFHKVCMRQTKYKIFIQIMS